MSMRAVFSNARERRTLATGEVLFSARDAGSQMFGVITGRIELRRGDQVLETVGADGTFGELAIIDDEPRTLTAVAVEPTDVAAINRQEFLFLVHETPMFAIQVMRSLSDRIKNLDATTAAPPTHHP
jgi:CRP-like cAMP-binding protein